MIRAGYDLPPLMFSAEVVKAIIVGLSLIGRTGDQGLVIAAGGVLQKVDAVLPARAIKEQEPPLLVSHWNAVPASEVDYQRIRRAIRDEQKLDLTYVDAQGARTDRTVRPIALIYYVDSAVLVACCELRVDFRHFRIDRIAGCAVSQARFIGEGHQLREAWRSENAPFS